MVIKGISREGMLFMNMGPKPGTLWALGSLGFRGPWTLEKSGAL